MTKTARVVLRLTQAVFAVATIAALIDNIKPVAFVAGLLFVLVGSFFGWQKLDAANRSKYDSTYPPDANETDDAVDEVSRTRRIGRVVDNKGKDVA